ncbi:MAG: MarR family winged helix-turn-helix transcriptional regulator [Thermoleophilia bacterium]
MIDDSLTPRAFETLERLSNLLRAQEREGGAEVGLHPVHLQALWFLGRANRYSDTPASVADYLGITRGAASTSIRVLRERGLLTERRDPDDGRVSRLSLSDAGRALLERELPPQGFDEAIAALGPDAETLNRLLVQVLRGVQRDAGGRTFGVCGTCSHFTTDSSGTRCGLTGEPLSPPEAELLCREHEDPVGA